MFRVRPIQKNDLDAVLALASQHGVGITTLPPDKTYLAKNIDWSLNSFSKKTASPEHEYYFFILEDMRSHQAVGTSAILSAAGHEMPFYSYRLSRVKRFCRPLNITNNYYTLHLCNDFEGKSELCTLFLDANCRENGNGRLLSLARTLFIANFKERFAQTVFAEMRGVSDEAGVSPFWESLGRQFFNLSFPEVDRLSTQTSKQFISDLMPRQPIYTNLLGDAARAVIGKPHPHTVPAMRLLEQEGLNWRGYVDIFDAGPTIEVERDLLRGVRRSDVLPLSGTINRQQKDLYLVSNTDIDFRCVISEIDLHESSCALPADTIAALEVKAGDPIRYIRLRKKS
jgi:arginine N-succinyltransferase